MKAFAVATILAVLQLVPLCRAEEPMSVETSWTNVPRCVGRIGKNPAMTIKNAPRGTKFINATLAFGDYALGGDRVLLRENGLIPEGTMQLMAPCVPGVYRWTIDAEDANGHVLATLQQNVDFPGAK
jgi:hypothetical protein